MQQLLLLSVGVRGERLSCSHVEKMCDRERECDRVWSGLLFIN